MAQGGFRRFVFVSVVSVVLVCAPLMAASASQKSGDAATTSGPARATEAPTQATSPDGAAQKTATAPRGLPFQLGATDLGRMLKRDASNASIMRIRGGATVLNVGGGFRSVLVVQITPDGKPEMSCIISEKDAERIFAPTPYRAPETQKEP